jgi:nitrogen regulatory protein P-II 1
MKMIEAIIKSCKLGEVEDALQEMGVEDFMESTIICHGHQKGLAMVYRGDEYFVDTVAKVKLEIIADDDSVEKIVEVIGAIAKTERTEDCRLFVLQFLEAC